MMGLRHAYSAKVMKNILDMSQPALKSGTHPLVRNSDEVEHDGLFEAAENVLMLLIKIN